jgi:hypothetical protein
MIDGCPAGPAGYRLPRPLAHGVTDDEDQRQQTASTCIDRQCPSHGIPADRVLGGQDGSAKLRDARTQRQVQLPGIATWLG